MKLSCSLLSSVLVFALFVGACSSDSDVESKTKTTQGASEAESGQSLCAKSCDALPTTCPFAVEDLKGGDCNAACLQSDSSTEFCRCLAEATSCEGMRACKDRF